MNLKCFEKLLSRTFLPHLIFKDAYIKVLLGSFRCCLDAEASQDIEDTDIWFLTKCHSRQGQYRTEPRKSKLYSSRAPDTKEQIIILSMGFQRPKLA